MQWISKSNYNQTHPLEVYYNQILFVLHCEQKVYALSTNENWILVEISSYLFFQRFLRTRDLVKYSIKMVAKEVDDYLTDLYYNLNNPESFSSIQRIYRSGKKKFPELKKKEVKIWFQKQAAATLHKPIRYKFPRNKTIVKRMGEQIQVDLCDMRNIAKHNDGYKYIVTGIDCFSRFGFGVKAKNKSGKEIASVLKSIFEKINFKRLQTDKGREFLNSDVKQLLRSTDTDLWISENDDVKAALVERFNRTIKDRMYKYFTANNTYRWIDVLPKLIENYNNTTHRTIKMKPIDVKEKDLLKLKSILYPQEKVKPMQLDVGDHVRISESKTPFRKGYLPNWSVQIYKIVTKFKRTRPVYEIADLNGVKLHGKFYAEELVKTEVPEEFHIEKIIRVKKDRNGKMKYLVKWVGYDSTYNSWIDQIDMRKL